MIGERKRFCECIKKANATRVIAFTMLVFGYAYDPAGAKSYSGIGAGVRSGTLSPSVPLYPSANIGGQQWAPKQSRGQLSCI